MKKAKKAVKNAIPYNFRIVQCSIRSEKIRRAKSCDFPVKTLDSTFWWPGSLSFDWEKQVIWVVLCQLAGLFPAELAARIL
jgi:hypothetical protein